MATRHGRSKRFARLRCDALEPRETPAADPVIDFAAGFTEAGLPGGRPAGYADHDLLLTDGPFQATAVWAPTRVDLRAFQTSFVFRLDGEPGRLGDGFTFALAAAPPPAPGTAGGGLGYQGVADSVAIKFDLVDNAGEGANSVGLFTGGAEPTTPAVTLDGTPIQLRSRHPIRADVAYDGAARTLTLALTDTAAPERTWTHQFVVDVPAAVGSPTGYAGFTAGTGELFARQAIESWTFAEGTPAAPGTPPAGPVDFGDGFAGAALARNGSAGVVGDRLRLADGPFQAGSAFAPGPVDVRGFNTSFRFRVGDAPSWWHGDGLTFVLQNAGPTAVGAAGGGLGYEGIATSVAVKFDLVDNAGEGTDSVGVFTNGAAPTTPADRLPPGREGAIHLNSGHVFRADLTYGDGTLRVELFDTETGVGFRRSYAVDVPAAVGGPTAYAGFTAGTGSLSAPIDVLDWTYAPTQDGGPAPPDGDGAPSLTVDVGVVAPGTITTVAGTGTQGYGGDEGPAAAAPLNRPTGVAVDAAGNLFIADQANQRVRRVDAATGIITTVAGTGVPDHNGDGMPATAANLGYPLGVAVDAAGNLFITETGNNRVRKVDAATGVITTVAGTGRPGYSGDGGPAASAAVGFPRATAVDAAGNLYIADANNGRIRKVDAATGVITTVAGTGERGYGGDGGPATEAALQEPLGVAVDAAGNLFIADQQNNRIRRVDAATGVITTVAGTGGGGFSGDGGPATAANLLSPTAVAVDAAGNLFISDAHNMRVRRVDAATGVITTVAGTGTGTGGYGGDGGPATEAALHYPFGLAVDATGNLFFADSSNNRIRKVAAATVREGDPATYAFTIRNTSPASTDPVTVTSVVDTLLGDLTAAARAANGGADVVLAPGQAFTFSHTAALNAGPAAGTVTVRGHDDEGTPAAATDGHTLTVTEVAPAIAVDAAVAAGAGTITTIAGTGEAGYGGDGGPATSALLDSPNGVAVDAAGNVYFADQANGRVRRVAAATGILTTVAGGGQGNGGDGGPATSALLYSPTGVALDAAGNLYFVDQGNQRVCRVDAATGVITTVVGTGYYGYAGDGGPATSATVTYPLGLTVDPAGNLYIADTYSNAIRRVDAGTGIITTVAGTGEAGYGGDGGPATAALLRYPSEVLVDAAGNLVFTDRGNNRVRKVDAATGVITTVAGTGEAGDTGDGGPATSATLNEPLGLALDAAGNLFFVDQGNNRVRRVDAATGVITTVAGTGEAGYGGDGGPATSAELRFPWGVAVDAAGNLYIADRNNHRIRKVAAAREGGPATYTLTIRNTSPASTDPVTVTSVVDTLLGDLTAAARAANGGADVVLAPGQAFTFSHTAALFGPDAGTVTVRGRDDEGTPAAATDGHTLTVTEVAPAIAVDAAVGAAVITTVAGTGVTGYGGDGGPATGANLSAPFGVAVDAAGNLFIADVGNHDIRKVDAATGIITTVAGNGTSGYYTGDGGPATGATIDRPTGVAVDAAGNLYIADVYNDRVRKVDAATGVITTVAGSGPPGYGGYGGDGGPAASARLNQPTGVAVDAAGNLYIADYTNNRVRRVDAATGIITTVAGNGTPGYTGDGGPAAGALLNHPVRVVVDARGNLFVADLNNLRVRKVDAATGVITTVAGNGSWGYAGDGGPAVSASLGRSYGMAVDAAGNLYIGDGDNLRVRRVDAATGIITTVAGNGSGGGGGDGDRATSASVSPYGVAVDALGNLYIADNDNHVIRKVGGKAGEAPVREGEPVTYTFTVTNTSPATTDPVTITGVTDTVLGDLAAAALAAHGAGPLVLAPSQSLTFRSTTAPLNAGVVAGVVTGSGHDDENTPVSAAAGYTVTVADVAPAITVDAAAGVSTGIITTVAGTGIPWSGGYGGDGAPAAGAYLYQPSGVAVDAAGNLYVADLQNNRVRRLDAATGTITTVAGTGVHGYGGDGGPATSAALSGPAGVAVDALGNLFIADEDNSRIRRVDAATGTITTVAGNGVRGYAGDGGPATSAELAFPTGVAVDAAGNVFIADRANNRVRRVDATTGVITTVAGNGAFRYSGDGGPATSAALGNPGALAVDGAGNLFIADTYNHRVRRVDAATGVITTLAGASGSGSWGDGGPASAAALSGPSGVAVDAAGNLFIADTYNHRVRRVDARTGIISIVAGTIVAGNPLAGYGGDGGPATGATLSDPTGVAVDGAGNLFIADTYNNRIRKVAAAAAGDGGPATYTVTIRNTSPASTDPVTVTSVTDTLSGDLTAVAVAANGGADIVLAPGQAFTFSVTGPVLGPGSVVNTVTVTAHDDEGTGATASDTETLTVN